MIKNFKYLKLFLALFMFISLNGCGTSTSSEIKIDDNVSVEPTQMIVSSKFDMNDNKFGDGSEPTAGWLHALLVLKVTNNGEKKYSFNEEDFTLANENGEIPGDIYMNNIEIFPKKSEYLIVDLGVQSDSPSEQLGVMYKDTKILVNASNKIVKDPMSFSIKKDGNTIEAENEELSVKAEFMYDKYEGKTIEGISYTIQNKTESPVLVPAFKVDTMYYKNNLNITASMDDVIFADDIFELVNQEGFKENDFLTMLNQEEELTVEEMNKYEEKLKSLDIYTAHSSCRLTQPFILTESQESDFEQFYVDSPVIHADLIYSYSMIY